MAAENYKSDLDDHTENGRRRFKQVISYPPDPLDVVSGDCDEGFVV